MNSRERILTALNHKEADRVPIDFGGIQSSIHQIGHKALLEYLGIPGYKVPIIDRMQMIVEPSPTIIEKFHCDVMPLFAMPGSGWKLNINPVDDTFIDEWGVKYIRPKGGYWYDLNDHPLKEGTLEELNNYKFPDPKDPGRVAGLNKKAKKLYEETDKALMFFQSFAGIFEHSFFLRGMENCYIDMVSNLKYLEILADKITEYMIDWWGSILDSAGEYVHVVQIGGDLGNQNGPLFNPKIYRKVYKPREKMLIDFLHKKAANAKVFMHSCGSIYEFLPDLIEIGVDIINPVQVSAKNMESGKLKKEFGKDLVFWGGGADVSVMTYSTVKKLEEEVRGRINDFAPGGGYVFAPIHNIQPNVPPENISTFFRAGYEFGQYPIED